MKYVVEGEIEKVTMKGAQGKNNIKKRAPYKSTFRGGNIES